MKLLIAYLKFIALRCGIPVVFRKYIIIYLIQHPYYRYHLYRYHHSPVTIDGILNLIARMRRHTIIAHHLCTHNRPYKWPNTTSPE